MKLPILKEFFDKIKSGEKSVEYRDAHITFQCIETGEELRKEITHVVRMQRKIIPSDIKNRDDIFDDEYVIAFNLR